MKSVPKRKCPNCGERLKVQLYAIESCPGCKAMLWIGQDGKTKAQEFKAEIDVYHPTAAWLGGV